MNRQKSPNSKRAPTHKGLRLSSRLAQRTRAEESLVDSDHDVGRLDDGDGVDGAFLDGLDGALDLVASADLHDAILSFDEEPTMRLRVTVVVPPLVRRHLHNRMLEHQGMRHRAPSTSVVPFRFVSSQREDRRRAPYR